MEVGGREEKVKKAISCRYRYRNCVSLVVMLCDGGRGREERVKKAISRRYRNCVSLIVMYVGKGKKGGYQL